MRHAHIEHIGAKADQQDGPIANDALDFEQIEIVEQENHAEHDQQNRRDGKFVRAAAHRKEAGEFVDD